MSTSDQAVWLLGLLAIWLALLALWPR